jgi:cation:H+ antiporter
MMFLYILSLVLGLVFLVWSADKFVDGASGLASFYGMPPLLILELLLLN